MEVKYAEGGSFDTACKKALTQLEDRGYVSALQQERCR
jgi:hypothetical protein